MITLMNHSNKSTNISTKEPSTDLNVVEQVDIISDEEILESINFITETLNYKVIPATSRSTSSHMARVSYYASSDIIEKGFITSTVRWNKSKLVTFKNNMDTTMRHLREITWNKFKKIVTECKKRIESERLLTNREKEIFELYDNIDEYVNKICDLMEEVKSLDYAGKLMNKWYYWLKEENKGYWKESLEKMLKLTAITKELWIQINFLRNDIITEWLWIKPLKKLNYKRYEKMKYLKNVGHSKKYYFESSIPFFLI